MSREFKVLLIVYCSFLVTMLFSLIPKSDEKFDLFLLYDKQISMQSYAYYFCEHISKTMIFYALWMAYQRVELRIVFFMEVIDLIDFVIIYNETWFKVLGFSLEYNDIKLVIVAILIIQVLWKPQRQL